MQRGSVSSQVYDKPNHWLPTHARPCAQLHTTADGRRITVMFAETLQRHKLRSFDARTSNSPARRGCVPYKNRPFVTAAAHGSQKPPTSTIDWSRSVSRATSQLLWHLAPRLAQLLQQASGDQPSLSALLAAEFITVANKWKQERVSCLPPIREAGLGALIDGWTLVQENFYMRQSISATDIRPQVPEDFLAATATTDASVNTISILSSVLVDPVTLIIAPELSASHHEASLSAWLSKRGLLTVTTSPPASRDNQAVPSLTSEGKHAFVMQQILELVMSPGTQRIISSFPPTPTAGWLATAATRIVDVSNALGSVQLPLTTDGNARPNNCNNSIDNNNSINGYGMSSSQQLIANSMTRPGESPGTPDIVTAGGAGAMLSLHQKLSDLGLAHLHSSVYLPIKDALQPHLGPNLLLCGWLFQLVVAAMVLYESNASRSSPDKLIICQAVAADLYNGIRVLQDAGMPLADHMALYLLTQQLAIGTELHELGLKQDILADVAMQVEQLAASISTKQPGLVLAFDAYHRLGEYHLHVTQDMPSARDALQKALVAFNQREARTCDGFQEWSDDLSICSLHSYWRDVSDTALQETMAKGTPVIQLASLPGAVYLYRDKLRCILNLVLIERLAKTTGSITLSSNWAAYSCESSLPAVTELLTEAARQHFANSTTKSPCWSVAARNENGAVDNEYLTDMYLHTTIAIHNVLNSWQSSMGIVWQQTAIISGASAHGKQPDKKRSRVPTSQQPLHLTLADIMSAPQPGLELCRLSNSFATRYKQHVQEQQQQLSRYVDNLVDEILSTLRTSGIVSHNVHKPVPHQKLGLLQDGSVVIRLLSPQCLQLLKAWHDRPPGMTAQAGTDLHSVLLIAQEVQAAVHISEQGSDCQLLTPLLFSELPAVVLANQQFGSQPSINLWRACQQLRCMQQGDHAQLVATVRHAQHLLESCGERRDMWPSFLEMQLFAVTHTLGDKLQQANADEPMLLSSHLFLFQQAAAAGDVQEVLESFHKMLSTSDSLLSGSKLDQDSSSSSVGKLLQLHFQAEQLLVNDLIAACNSLFKCISTAITAGTAADGIVSLQQDGNMLQLFSGCMFQALQLGCRLSCNTGAQLQAAVLCGCAQHDHTLVVKVLKQAVSDNTYIHSAALSQCLEHYLAIGHITEAVTITEALIDTSKLHSADNAVSRDYEINAQAFSSLVGCMTSLAWLVVQTRDTSLADRMTDATLALPFLGRPACMNKERVENSRRSARFQVLDQICAAALHFNMYEWLEIALPTMLKDSKYDGGIAISVQPPQSIMMAVTKPAQLQPFEGLFGNAEDRQQGLQSDSYNSLASRLAAVLLAGQLTAKKCDTLLALQWSVMQAARNATADGCYTAPVTEFVDHVIQMLIAKDDDDTTLLAIQVLEQATVAGYLSQAALSSVLCHGAQNSSSMLLQLSDLVLVIPTSLWTASLERAFNTLSASSNHAAILQLLRWLLEPQCQHVKSSYIPSEQICKVLLHASCTYIAEAVGKLQAHETQATQQVAQVQLDVAPELLAYLKSAPAKAQAHVFIASVNLAASSQGAASVAGIVTNGLSGVSEQQTAWPQQPSLDHNNMNGLHDSTSEFRHHLFVAMAALGNLSTSRLGSGQSQMLPLPPAARRRRWNKLQATAVQTRDDQNNKQQYAATCAQLLQLLADSRPGMGLTLPTLLPRNAPVVQSKQPVKRFKRPTRWRQGFLPEASNNSAQAQLLCTVYERSFAWCSHDLIGAAPLSTMLSVCQAYLIEQKLELAVGVAIAAPSDTSIPLMTFLLNCPEVTNARVLPTTMLVEIVQQACLLRSPALLQQALQLVSDRGRLPALIRSIRRQTFASMMLLLLRQPPSSAALALTRAWVEHQHTVHGQANTTTSGNMTWPARNVRHSLHAQQPSYSTGEDEETTDNIMVRRLSSNVWHSIARSSLQHVTVSNTRESCLVAVELAMLCANECQPQYAMITRCAIAAAVIQTDLPVRYAADTLTATEEALAMCEVTVQPGPVLDALVTLLNQVLDKRSQQVQPVAKHIAAISSWVLPVLSKLPLKQRQALSDSAHRALLVLLCEHGPSTARDAWRLWQNTREGLKLSRDTKCCLLVTACEQATWDIAYELSTDLLRNEWPLVMKGSSKPLPSAHWHQLSLEEKFAHISVMSACQGRVMDCFQVLHNMLETGSWEQPSLPESLLAAIQQGLTHQECTLSVEERSAVSKALNLPFNQSSKDHVAEIKGDPVNGTSSAWPHPAQQTICSVIAALSDIHCTAN